MDFRGGDQIDGKAVAVEDLEDVGEEAVRARPLVGVHIQDDAVVLYGDRSRSFRPLAVR